jgi:hypothetical protein
MRTTLRRPLLAAVPWLALAAPIVALAVPASAAALPTVVINEVESNGDATDWVEIMNTGTETVDVSGWVIKDNDDTRTLAIPAGTSLAAGAYLAVDVDVKATAGNFGLGGADQARLFLADGVTLVDGYTWAAHADVTYGRYPNGTGAFAQTAVATKGAANALVIPKVKINEIESNGDTADWIEIMNAGTSPVDVSGWVLKDDTDTRTLAIPAGTTLAAGAYLAVDVDVKTTPGNFGLGAADKARLYLADGVTLVDEYAWTAHAAISYGRYPNGSGSFVQTAVSSKGAANANPVAPTPGTADPTKVRINEIESNGDTADWVELVNTGSVAIDVSGWILKDDSDARTLAIAAGTSIAPGAYLAVDVNTATTPGNFGLGAADKARLFLADGITMIDSVEWTEHAATTLGRYPNGTGDFSVTSSSTKGAANPVAVPTLPKVRINEVESNGDTTDWIEIVNAGTTAVNVSGWVLKDDDDTRTLAISANTILAAGAYLAIDVDVKTTAGNFGLGGADTARLFLADGSTLIDSYAWTQHATTTYGRCADTTGDFTTTKAATKGAVNSCAGDIVSSPWPGAAAVSTVDPKGTYAENMSGLAYEAAASANTLWAVQNNPGKLYRLTDDGTNWVSGSTGGWGAGKTLHFANGTGNVDAEGVVLTDAGAAGGVYVSTERDNAVSGVSHLSVLRFDVSSAATELTATKEWNLTADLPVVGSNLGLEAISWVPDSFLVSKGLLDQSTGKAYDPARYAGHGTGLFFVGLEGGGIYAYALDAGGGYTRVATVPSTGLAGVMELEFDAATGKLWAVCDDTCDGRSATLEIGANGLLAATAVIERPAGMPNLNNEGFAMAPQSQCVAGAKSVFWSDDSSTGGYALRQGSIECAATTPAEPTMPTDPATPITPVTPVTPVTPLPGTGTPVAPVANVGATTPVSASGFTSAARGPVEAPSDVRAGQTITIVVGIAHAAETVNIWLHSTPVLLATTVVAADGTVRVVIPADAPAGAHRVAVLAADGTLIGWDNVQIAAVRLAATGTDLEVPVAAALLLLLAGIGLTLARRVKPRAS